MAENVEKNVFDAVISSMLGAIAFLYAWVIRNTTRANKTSVSVATILEAVKKPFPGKFRNEKGFNSNS